MVKLNSPLAVVCYDAGAANLIFSWLKDWPGKLRPFMDGPAKKMWKLAFPSQPLESNLKDVFQDAKALLTGTGWESNLEHDARVIAAERGVYSVATLDHWVNYSQRFERSGICQLPDKLWVADEYAESIARKTFPDVEVDSMPNLYLIEQLNKIGNPPCLGNMLYFLEPVRNDWGRGRPGEFQALDYTLENLRYISDYQNPKIILRLHPSESHDKYQEYLSRYNFIRIDESPDVASAINNADIVLGVESFALTVALKAKRPVFSTLPPWAPPIRLPQQEIIQLRKLSEL